MGCLRSKVIAPSFPFPAGRRAKLPTIVWRMGASHHPAKARTTIKPIHPFTPRHTLQISKETRRECTSSSCVGSWPAVRKMPKVWRQRSRSYAAVNSSRRQVRFSVLVQFHRSLRRPFPGLIVTERNYLDVYVYDKWASKTLPSFEIGEEFDPSSCTLKEGQTSAPKYLTEADLVTLMDKNGIGELTSHSLYNHMNF